FLPFKSHPYYTHIYGGRGYLYGKLGQIDSCIWNTQAALAQVANMPTLRGLDPSVNPPTTVWLSVSLIDRLQQKAESLTDLYHQHPERKDFLDIAWQTYELLIQFDQRMSSHLLFAREEVSLSDPQTFYEGMMACAHTLHKQTQDEKYLKAVWQVMEARKARRLQAEQHLAALLQTGNKQPVWRQTLADLDNQLIFWESKKARIGLEDRAISPEWPYIENQIFSLRRERRELLERHTTGPEGIDFYIPFQDFQDQLASNQYALSYFWGDSTVTGMGIGPTGTILYRWRINPQDQDTLEALRASILQPRRQGSEHAQAIFNRWVAPLLPAGAIPGRLVILPDGPLHHIPFEILQPQEHPLIRHSAIRYLYAGQLVRPYPALEPTARVLSIGPTYPGQHPVASRGITRKAWSDFAPLQYNEAEATHIAKAWGGQLQLNDAATESAFREASRGADILHLAMHAYADPENPQYSALVFAPPAASDTAMQDEGFLYGYEIPSLLISPKLVVLSACETAQGPILLGEGVMSLARAFALLQCPRTLTTRWQVDDAATQQIMTDFHAHIRQGLAPDLALQQAQLAYIDRFPEAPYRFWAPFMLVDHSVQQSYRWWWMYVAAALVGVLVLIGYQVVRRRQAHATVG
ncbi:MAG: CHAT domain-containing protein, partial [Bacteroidota bacterium]